MGGDSRIAIRAVALAASAVIFVAACGDSDDNGDDASDEATEEPAEESGGEDVDVEGLDYAGALFTIEDFEGFVPGDYVAGDEGAIEDLPIRALCGENPAGPEAVAGYELYFEDSENTMVFGTAVLAFATEQEAEEASELSRAVAESCETYVSEASGNSFTREPPPGISESGDESFDLFARSDGGLLLGDHFVREGQFVLDVRVNLEQNSAFSAETLATMAEEAQKKFNDWVEEQAGG